MSNFCVDLENRTAFVYEQTLESKYLQGRFGAVPIIKGATPHKPQFAHHHMKVENPKLLAKELRKFADELEEGREDE